MGKYNDWAEKKAAEIERMRAQGGQAVREAASDSPGVGIHTQRQMRFLPSSSQFA